MPPKAITGANQKPVIYHANQSTRGKLKIVISVVVPSFILYFPSMPKIQTTLAPRITDPLRVLFISVHNIVKKRLTPPAIKKVLRDLVPFKKLATQLVAPVNPTMTSKTLLNSKVVRVLIHQMRTSDHQKAIWSTIEARESSFFCITR